MQTADAARKVGEATVSLQTVTEQVEDLRSLVAQVQQQTKANRQHRVHLQRKVDDTMTKKMKLLETLNVLNRQLAHSNEDVRLLREERSNALLHHERALEELEVARASLRSVDQGMVEAERQHNIALVSERNAKERLSDVEKRRQEALKESRALNSNMKRLKVSTAKRTTASDYYGTLLQSAS